MWKLYHVILRLSQCEHHLVILVIWSTLEYRGLAGSCWMGLMSIFLLQSRCLSSRLSFVSWVEGSHSQLATAIRRNPVLWSFLKLDAQLEVECSFTWNNVFLSQGRKWIIQCLHCNIPQLWLLRLLIGRSGSLLPRKCLMELIKQLFDAFFESNSLVHKDVRSFSSYLRRFGLKCVWVWWYISKSGPCHHWKTSMTLSGMITKIHRITVTFWRFSSLSLHHLILLWLKLGILSLKPVHINVWLIGFLSDSPVQLVRLLLS